ncbi:flagellar biosynthetic protein FliR [Devosia insulae DS-56]|uniref:Flagellar biosynthetic protein FliR n=1 Tax=Devosia insulae DS-56 TaxID=1116389 RepID=A0A1E5XL28_9HYPH|nr:flagellar biosynthetic protein FliR [Devosia insulae]OEO29310.1 flagellar biosynthetic protein FliR [Devosia insulae DS-56]
MISLNWLPETAYFYVLIFARVGAMLMLIPALGETAIPARMRLSFALVFAAVLYPIVSPQLPALPTNLPEIVVVLLHEVIVGLILGAIARLAVSGTQTAGAVIASSSGLSVAQAADPTNGGVQGALIGAFLSFLGIALIFATDLHHVALSAVHDSYMIFTPKEPLMFGDAAQTVVDTVAGAFVIGVQMSAPFIVFGLVFNLGMGILSRLMPQLQVFFIAMPATVGVGLILMALLLAMMMGLYLMHFEGVLAMLRGVR